MQTHEYIFFFSKPLSSLVFGVNALFVKPAQSIAPLAVVHYLNSYGYEVRYAYELR